jgi:pyruvate formate lyase activating enzyme
MKYVYIGNVPESGAASTLCPACNRVVIERKGYFISGNNIKEGRCLYCGNPVSGIWN